MPDDSAVQLPENSRIVHPDYLNKGLNSNKNDLIRRLRNLVKILRSDEVETESPEWPGLASTAQLLMTTEFLNHRDQEVRLFTVLACVEILTLDRLIAVIWLPCLYQYAPDVPWDESQIIQLFQQMTRHLGNLAITNGQSKSSDMFQHYAHILQYTAEYKLGCLLVDMDKDENESARETQIDFFHTLLSCLHHEHPTDLIAQVRDAIVATLEEYDGVAIPIPLLDELLKCIGQGPTCTIVDPKAGPKRSKRNGKLPERQVKNPSFIAASGIIQQLMNRLALPISQLLNGLLQREPYYVGKSTIQCTVEDGESVNEVHQIIYHLHRVAPQVLTTVMGTISNDLSSPDADQRLMVVQLLGRLFAVDKTADQYAACFREWLRRCQDVDVRLRVSMVDHCMVMIRTASGESVQLAAEALRGLVRDPSADVRSTAIRAITESVFQSKEDLPFLADLLHAVGDRVSSKHKAERQDAITGLAHVYNKRFLVPKLQLLVEKGEDCDLEIVLATLRRQHSSRHGDDNKGVYEWIPSMVFRCLYFTDAIDSEMRSKVVHLIDSVLLKGLTPSAAAVAWAIVFDSLDDKDRAFLTQMFKQRALLQKELASYIEKRSYCRGLERGSEEAITAESQAFEQLEAVSRLTVPVEGADPEIVLKKFHTAKDKRIFHLLSSTTDATDSKTARIRALEELPPRTRPLGEATSTWIQNLVKRSAMGESLNAEIVENCVVLAQECLKEEEVTACKAFLQTVELAVQVFPDICNTGETKNTLAKLLSDCGGASGQLRKSLNTNHIVTLLSSIMSNATSSTIPDGQNISYENDELKTQLTNLCTREGTPDQAYNAVHSLAKLLNPSSSWDEDGSNNFAELLQTLTSASRLKLNEGSSNNSVLVTILSSLSALMECSPLSFSSSRGKRAVNFALDVVLLGRNEENASDDEQSQADHDQTTPASNRGRKSVSSSRKAATPEKTGVLEDISLSLTCKRLCASIQFLVSYVRFSRFAKEWNKTHAPSSDIVEINHNIIATVVQTLTQIVIDQGLPPSHRDRNFCKSRRERAALRQISAISLLRLCDPRAGIEKDFLSLTMWHVLAGAFLDEETVVREAIFKEYSDMLSGNGAFGSALARLQPTIPSLRFLSYICLTSDGDHDHDAANGSAANVGTMVSTLQSVASRSIVASRRTSEAYYARCKALGQDALKRYETITKMNLMPENALPYAYHLLTHRRETPTTTVETGADPPGDDCDDDGSPGLENEHQLKILERRLLLLFDPLIESLGEYADNISYLIRVTETLCKYGPIDVSLQYSAVSQSGCFSLRSPSNQVEDVDGQGKLGRSTLLNARLMTICSVAREILLTYIKQDVNLTPYPGKISFPNGLFRQAASGVVVVKSSGVSGNRTLLKKKRSSPLSGIAVHKPNSDDEWSTASADPTDASSKRTTKSTKKRSTSVNSTPAKAVFEPEMEDEKPTNDTGLESGKSSRVHFSPDINQGPPSVRKNASVSPKWDSVNSTTSPATLATTSSNAAATLGASPPPTSLVPTSTALDDYSDNDEMPCGKSTSQSLASVSRSVEDSQSSRSSSRRRKQPERFLLTPNDEEQTRKKQKKTPPPKQISLKNDLSRSALGSSSSKPKKVMTKNLRASDDLDFPPGEENHRSNRTSKGTRHEKG